MGFLATKKPHAVCIPYSAQGHINPMLKLAKLLHAHSFHITFVLTEYNHSRLVRRQGPESTEGRPDFGFSSIPDGLPLSEEGGTQDIPALSESTTKNCLAPFRRLLADLNTRAAAPPVSCIVSDGAMTFTLDAARELGIPEILFWTASACGYLTAIHVHNLVDRHLIPLTDMADVSNGFLDTEVADWVPGLTEGMRLKDFPSFIRTTDASDIMFKYLLRETGRASMASAIVINTFDLLEARALAALESILPPIYTIGPLSILACQRIPVNSPLASITTSLWKEEETSLKWLQGKEAGSVVNVNFGSITVMSKEQLIEFAWGLSNSGYNFLWVIRPDLVRGETSVLRRILKKGIVFFNN